MDPLTAGLNFGTAFLFICLSCSAQIIVSMDLMSTKGTSPAIGRGVGAYTWNLHMAPIGAIPVPFTLIRMNFPEVRLYSRTQQDAILAQRIADSPARHTLKWLGYLSAGAGLGLQINNTLSKSPSQIGTVITLGGLALPVVTTLATSQLPAYAIKDPCPDTIQIPMGGALDCTALANFGKASVSIPPRRIDPITSDPLKGK